MSRCVFSFPSFRFKLFVGSVLLVSNLLVFFVSSFSVSGTEIFSWIGFRIYVFQAVVYGTVFGTIPAGLPGPGGFITWLQFRLFSCLLRKPSTIWRETSRLKNPETGVLGTRKIGTREYYRVNSGSVLKIIK